MAKRQPGDVVANEEEAQRLARLLLAADPHPRDYRDDQAIRKFVALALYDTTDAYVDVMARRVKQIVEWTPRAPKGSVS